MLQILLLTGSLLLSVSEKPKLVVLDLTPAGGVERSVAGAVNDAVVSELAGRGFFEVMSSKEVQTLLGFERQKQMVGCSDDASSCLTELAGAMGARFVMSGTLAKLGDAYQLSLQTLDSNKAQPIGRSIHLAKDLSTLMEQLPYAVAEASATPLPPEPSKLVPYSLLGAGALALVGGGIVGLQALSQEEVVRQELRRGESSGVPIRTVAEYAAEGRTISRNKTIAFVALATGAVLAGAGLYWSLTMPSTTGRASGQTLALVPQGNGFALTGSLP